jgi:hypothetical protein
MKTHCGFMLAIWVRSLSRMLFPTAVLRFRVAPQSLPNSIRAAICITLVYSAHAGIESGTYHAVPGATLLEVGDNVPNGSRVVPLSATLTFNLADAQPSLTAVIHNAVLEGGSPYADQWLGGLQQPFELTLHSLAGSQLPDGSYKFSGDYLKDIYPSRTQYIFDWQFSSVGGADPVWSGTTYWAGGHIWAERISDVALVPEPGALKLIWTGTGIFWMFASRKNCKGSGTPRCWRSR